MSLPPLAPVAAMERRLGVAPGTLAGADLVRAGAALDDASTMVRAEAGNDWVAADGTTVTAPPVVVTVVVSAALRTYRNPDGYSGESVGDYSYQYARDSTSGYLTPAEVRIIRQAAGRTGQAVYSIRTPSAYEGPPAPGLPPAVVA
ncbi:hypothetical protein [Micromonospora okii]|uniref:hypothetical protein n=1 Tax=Micromonospora okii TaxID=1182970 RepID=UPI001E528CCB|nr:hypothetical protein [Micromonospora okii]